MRKIFILFFLSIKANYSNSINLEENLERVFTNSGIKSTLQFYEIDQTAKVDLIAFHKDQKMKALEEHFSDLSWQFYLPIG